MKVLETMKKHREVNLNRYLKLTNARQYSHIRTIAKTEKEKMPKDDGIFARLETY